MLRNTQQKSLFRFFIIFNLTKKKLRDIEQKASLQKTLDFTKKQSVNTAASPCWLLYTYMSSLMKFTPALNIVYSVGHIKRLPDVSLVM